MFDRNIDSKGRFYRGFGGLALLMGAVFGFMVGAWLGWLMIGSAVFLLFQALRGWCVLRACGINTRT